MNNRIDPQKLDHFLGKQDSDRLRSALQKGDKNALMNSLNDTDKEVLRSFMNDREAREKLLSSPEVQSLISGLFGKR